MIIIKQRILPDIYFVWWGKRYEVLVVQPFINVYVFNYFTKEKNIDSIDDNVQIIEEDKDKSMENLIATHHILNQCALKYTTFITTLSRNPNVTITEFMKETSSMNEIINIKNVVVNNTTFLRHSYWIQRVSLRIFNITDKT